jgi:chemotaxis protein methyltransferase CheR
VTSFFRDPAHFAFLERELYAPLARGTIAVPGRRLRLWSAACSTGAEPYSLAMQALELLPPGSGFDVRILATDLSNKALAGCRDATYSEAQLAGLSPERRARFLERTNGPKGPAWRVKEEVRRMVEIRRLNLVEPFVGLGPFDVVFLRNVMIYFDRDTRLDIVSRMGRVVRPGGVLAVGSAETLSGLDVPFKAAAASVYLR